MSVLSSLVSWAFGVETLALTAQVLMRSGMYVIEIIYIIYIYILYIYIDTDIIHIICIGGNSDQMSKIE